MKFVFGMFAIGLAALSAGCDKAEGTAEEPDGGSAVDTSAVVATVNDVPITQAMFDLYVSQVQSRGSGGEVNRTAVLDEVIRLELARQAGLKLGVEKDLDTRLKVEQQSRAVVAAAAIEHYLDANPVTDGALLNLYEAQLGSGSQYRVRHLLVRDEQLAKELIAELDRGADFAELAKRHSLDASAGKGGDLGWVSREQLMPPMSGVVAALGKGGYTKRPFSSAHGWHILKVQDVRKVAQPSFEQAKAPLETLLKKQRVDRYIDGLKREARIDVVVRTEAAAGDSAR